MCNIKKTLSYGLLSVVFILIPTRGFGECSAGYYDRNSSGGLESNDSLTPLPTRDPNTKMQHSPRGSSYSGTGFQDSPRVNTPNPNEVPSEGSGQTGVSTTGQLSWIYYGRPYSYSPTYHYYPYRPYFYHYNYYPYRPYYYSYGW